MKRNLVFLVGVVTFVWVTFADVVVTGVSACQRYPWNGLVDITVMVQGEASDVANSECIFSARNSALQSSLPIVHLTRAGADSGSGLVWSRRYIWDAMADIGGVKVDDVILTVNIELGVQLWKDGPYWSICNVGATKPDEYGCYFWWGDTIGYKHGENGWNAANGTRTGFLFASVDQNCPTYGKNDYSLNSAGFLSYSTHNLYSSCDAAVSYLGRPWRMPTDAEFDALVSNCDTVWSTLNGVYGRVVKGRGDYSSRSIFLPAAGFGNFSSLSGSGTVGQYWSSTSYSTYNSATTSYSWGLSMAESYFRREGDNRYVGKSIRPIRDFEQKGEGDNYVTQTHLSLDCRTGIRTIRGDGEKLYYDASWYERGTRVSITDNGEMLVSGGAGVKYWVPEGGKHHLQLTVVNDYGVKVGEASADFDGLCVSDEGVLRYERVNDKAIVAGRMGCRNELVIPATIDDYPVVAIGDHAFEACTDLMAVEIPNSVTTIFPSAFAGCTNVENVVLPFNICVCCPGFYEAEFREMNSYSDDNNILEKARTIVLSADMLTSKTSVTHTMYGYAAFMWFEGGVTYEFMAGYDDRASVMIDGDYVIQAASTDCQVQMGSIVFDEGGGHWIEIIVLDIDNGCMV